MTGVTPRANFERDVASDTRSRIELTVPVPYPVRNEERAIIDRSNHQLGMTQIDSAKSTYERVKLLSPPQFLLCCLTPFLNRHSKDTQKVYHRCLIPLVS